jgi:glycyl-tRNA synthetase beta chain
MVSEFPKLQGVMGMEYARHSGEDMEVARAIYEHYLPAFSGDELPETLPGIILSIADKMDNIVAGFALGYVPTGTADPFGYRRQALGIVSILLKSGISITISEICRVVIKHLKEKMEFNEEEVHRTVLEFFKTRLSGVLYADGFPKEFVDAVITVDSLNPVEIKDKINSLVLISKQERFNNLLLAYKRIVNILGNKEFFEISEDKLVEEAEKNLYIAFLNAEKQCGDKLHQKKYVEAVEELFNLIEPVNNFFDTVLIMSEDIMLRQNRLALLNNLKKLFLQFADFSKLPIKNTEVQK